MSPQTQTDAKPLRSYLDKALFGLMALLLTIVIGMQRAVAVKVDEATSEIAALKERVLGTKERLERVDTRMDRVEQYVFLRRKDVGAE